MTGLIFIGILYKFVVSLPAIRSHSTESVTINIRE